ncbi:hypothetical protein [Alteromonas halophila]|uniref:CPXCG motif-containing cysteine-rich protein n=1 Tax=Alteromonas halophila TaxID=516698 RepID=A0A918JJJ4_9ALTE|nr:hypothetical protein [Alteromonas halophila]GGW83385.1 hypothetical protein GCM10007391_16060 [Alteromonas halophila]
MDVSDQLEYLCPHCGSLNQLVGVIDMYREQTAFCQHCRTKLEIVPANGLDKIINLIVTVAEDTPVR